MKKLFLILTIVFWCSSVNAQECVTGPVVISTQAQLDAFDAEPRCVDGALTLSGNNNIPDFRFRNLTYVNGTVSVIYRRPPTAWILTFESLERVEGGFKVGSNPRLTRVAIGSSFLYAGFVKIYGNSNMTSVSLGGIESTYDFSVYSNDKLTSFAAGDLDTADDVSIYSNPLLPTCAISDLICPMSYDTVSIYGNHVDSCYPFDEADCL